MNKESIETKIQWQPMIEMIIVLVTILGSTIPLYLQNSNQISAIQQEIKDFHGRLEKQDAEFRGIMAKQDCEFRGIMAKQDFEFKTHLIYEHAKREK